MPRRMYEHSDYLDVSALDYQEIPDGSEDMLVTEDQIASLGDADGALVAPINVYLHDRGSQALMARNMDGLSGPSRQRMIEILNDLPPDQFNRMVQGMTPHQIMLFLQKVENSGMGGLGQSDRSSIRPSKEVQTMDPLTRAVMTDLVRNFEKKLEEQGITEEGVLVTAAELRGLGQDIERGAVSFGADISRGAAAFGADISRGAAAFGADISRGAAAFGADISRGAAAFGQFVTEPEVEDVATVDGFGYDASHKGDYPGDGMGQASQDMDRLLPGASQVPTGLRASLLERLRKQAQQTGTPVRVTKSQIVRAAWPKMLAQSRAISRGIRRGTRDVARARRTGQVPPAPPPARPAPHHGTEGAAKKYIKTDTFHQYPETDWNFRMFATASKPLDKTPASQVVAVAAEATGVATNELAKSGSVVKMMDKLRQVEVVPPTVPGRPKTVGEKAFESISKGLKKRGVLVTDKDGVPLAVVKKPPKPKSKPRSQNLFALLSQRFGMAGYAAPGETTDI